MPARTPVHFSRAKLSPFFYIISRLCLSQAPPSPFTLRHMATERQIRANRANAAKSTGPITPEGKRKVSQNSSLRRLESESAIQEGILEGKSLRRYNALAAELTRELQPRNSTEEVLVKTMTLARWRLFSIRELETAGLQREIDRTRQDHPSIGFRDALALAFRNLADNPRTLLRQHRLETRYERDFFKACTMLMNLRQTGITQPGEVRDRGLRLRVLENRGQRFLN